MWSMCQVQDQIFSTFSLRVSSQFVDDALAVLSLPRLRPFAKEFATPSSWLLTMKRSCHWTPQNLEALFESSEFAALLACVDYDYLHPTQDKNDFRIFYLLFSYKLHQKCKFGSLLPNWFTINIPTKLLNYLLRYMQT